eukprot:701301-Rhodomonas_salina.4
MLAVQGADRNVRDCMPLVMFHLGVAKHAAVVHSSAISISTESRVARWNTTATWRQTVGIGSCEKAGGTTCSVSTRQDVARYDTCRTHSCSVVAQTPRQYRALRSRRVGR